MPARTMDNHQNVGLLFSRGKVSSSSVWRMVTLAERVDSCLPSRPNDVSGSSSSSPRRVCSWWRFAGSDGVESVALDIPLEDLELQRIAAGTE